MIDLFGFILSSKILYRLQAIGLIILVSILSSCGDSTECIIPGQEGTWQKMQTATVYPINPNVISGSLTGSQMGLSGVNSGTTPVRARNNTWTPVGYYDSTGVFKPAIVKSGMKMKVQVNNNSFIVLKGKIDIFDMVTKKITFGGNSTNNAKDDMKNGAYVDLDGNATCADTATTNNPGTVTVNGCEKYFSTADTAQMKRGISGSTLYIVDACNVNVNYCDSSANDKTGSAPCSTPKAGDTYCFRQCMNNLSNASDIKNEASNWLASYNACKDAKNGVGVLRYGGARTGIIPIRFSSTIVKPNDTVKITISEADTHKAMQYGSTSSGSSGSSTAAQACPVSSSSSGSEPPTQSSYPRVLSVGGTEPISLYNGNGLGLYIIPITASNTSSSNATTDTSYLTTYSNPDDWQCNMGVSGSHIRYKRHITDTDLEFYGVPVGGMLDPAADVSSKDPGFSTVKMAVLNAAFPGITEYTDRTGRCMPYDQLAWYSGYFYDFVTPGIGAQSNMAYHIANKTTIESLSANSACDATAVQISQTNYNNIDASGNIFTRLGPFSGFQYASNTNPIQAFLGSPDPKVTWHGESSEYYSWGNNIRFERYVESNCSVGANANINSIASSGGTASTACPSADAGNGLSRFVSIASDGSLPQMHSDSSKTANQTPLNRAPYFISGGDAPLFSRECTESWYSPIWKSCAMQARTARWYQDLEWPSASEPQMKFPDIEDLTNRQTAPPQGYKINTAYSTNLYKYIFDTNYSYYFHRCILNYQTSEWMLFNTPGDPASFGGGFSAVSGAFFGSGGSTISAPSNYEMPSLGFNFQDVWSYFGGMVKNVFYSQRYDPGTGISTPTSLDDSMQVKFTARYPRQLILFKTLINDPLNSNGTCTIRTKITPGSNSTSSSGAQEIDYKLYMNEPYGFYNVNTSLTSSDGATIKKNLTTLSQALINVKTETFKSKYGGLRMVCDTCCGFKSDNSPIDDCGKYMMKTDTTSVLDDANIEFQSAMTALETCITTKKPKCALIANALPSAPTAQTDASNSGIAYTQLKNHGYSNNWSGYYQLTDASKFISTAGSDNNNLYIGTLADFIYHDSITYPYELKEASDSGNIYRSCKNQSQEGNYCIGRYIVVDRADCSSDQTKCKDFLGFYKKRISLTFNNLFACSSGNKTQTCATYLSTSGSMPDYQSGSSSGYIQYYEPNPTSYAKCTNGCTGGWSRTHNQNKGEDTQNFVGSVVGQFEINRAIEEIKLSTSIIPLLGVLTPEYNADGALTGIKDENGNYVYQVSSGSSSTLSGASSSGASTTTAIGGAQFESIGSKSPSEYFNESKKVIAYLSAGMLVPQWHALNTVINNGDEVEIYSSSSGNGYYQVAGALNMKNGAQCIYEKDDDHTEYEALKAGAHICNTTTIVGITTAVFALASVVTAWLAPIAEGLILAVCQPFLAAKKVLGDKGNNNNHHLMTPGAPADFTKRACGIGTAFRVLPLYPMICKKGYRLMCNNSSLMNWLNLQTSIPLGEQDAAVRQYCQQFTIDAITGNYMSIGQCTKSTNLVGTSTAAATPQYIYYGPGNYMNSEQTGMISGTTSTSNVSTLTSVLSTRSDQCGICVETQSLLQATDGSYIITKDPSSMNFLSPIGNGTTCNKYQPANAASNYYPYRMIKSYRIFDIDNFVSDSIVPSSSSSGTTTVGAVTSPSTLSLCIIKPLEDIVQIVSNTTSGTTSTTTGTTTATVTQYDPVFYLNSNNSTYFKKIVTAILKKDTKECSKQLLALYSIYLANNTDISKVKEQLNTLDTQGNAALSSITCGSNNVNYATGRHILDAVCAGIQDLVNTKPVNSQDPAAKYIDGLSYSYSFSANQQYGQCMDSTVTDNDPDKIETITDPLNSNNSLYAVNGFDSKLMQTYGLGQMVKTGKSGAGTVNVVIPKELTDINTGTVSKLTTGLLAFSYIPSMNTANNNNFDSPEKQFSVFQSETEADMYNGYKISIGDGTQIYRGKYLYFYIQPLDPATKEPDPSYYPDVCAPGNADNQVGCQSKTTTGYFDPNQYDYWTLSQHPSLFRFWDYNKTESGQATFIAPRTGRLWYVILDAPTSSTLVNNTSYDSDGKVIDFYDPNETTVKPANYRAFNYGAYQVSTSVQESSTQGIVSMVNNANGTASTVVTFVAKGILGKIILEPIMTILFGPLTSDGASYQWDQGLLAKFFQAITGAAMFQIIYYVVIILSVLVFGAKIFLGTEQFRLNDVVQIMIRIAIISAFASPQSWQWYAKFIVTPAVLISQNIIASVAGQFVTTDLLYSGGSFLDIAFGPVDAVLDYMFAKETIYRLIAVFFTSFPSGVIVFCLVVKSFIAFVKTAFEAVIAYVATLFGLFFALFFGPFAILALAMDQTKDKTKEWLKTLYAVISQQVFLFLSLSMFTTLYLNLTKGFLSFIICWEPLIVLPVLNITLISSWRISGAIPAQMVQQMGEYAPNAASGTENISVLTALILWGITKMMGGYIDKSLTFGAQLFGAKPLLSLSEVKSKMDNGIKAIEQKLKPK